MHFCFLRGENLSFLLIFSTYNVIIDFMWRLFYLTKYGYVWEYREIYRKNHPYRLRIADPFLLFHYHFLSGPDHEQVKSFQSFITDEGKYLNWRGHAFENLCMAHIPEIKKALGITGVETKEYPWTSDKAQGGAQIDLVIERKDHITDLCEIKYTDQPFRITADYEYTLLNKLEVFRDETKSKQALKIVMISSEGLSGTAHRERIAHVITLDDLFIG